MAADDLTSLIRIGPLTGLDATTAGPYLQQGKVSACVNANPTRLTQALANERGRALVNTFQGRAGTYTIAATAPYTEAYNDTQVLMDFSTGSADQLDIYDPGLNSTRIVTNGQKFTQAVQFQNTLYTNGGQQYSSLNPTNAYQWQYAMPPYLPNGVAGGPPPGSFDIRVQGTNTTSGAVTSLVPGVVYYYAFSWVFMDSNGAFMQETSVNGLTPVPETVIQADGIHTGVFTVLPWTIPTGAHDTTPAPLPGGDNSITITVGGGLSTAVFSGTTSDGATWTTNIYRQSSVQPVWTLVASGVTGGIGASYIDGAADTSIAGNASPPTHDQPPFTIGTFNPAPICVHKDRTWVFSNVSNTQTNNQQQSQLWYSDYGTPWSFNAAEQVLLVGQENTTNDQMYFGQGDHPMALASLSTILMAFKSRTTWLVYGDNEADFTPIKLFDVGCRSTRSIVASQGLVFWLSEQGIYLYDGSVPQYVSEPVRDLIESVAPTDQVNAVGMYAHNTYYLSFPVAGFTLAYNVPLSMWWTVPYSTPCAFSIPANPSEITFGGSNWMGQVIAVNQQTNNLTSTPELDFWFATENDLGSANSFTVTSGTTDSGKSNWEKEYRFVTLVAPYQNGVSATVTLTVDGGVLPGNSLSYTFDLGSGGSQPQTRHIAAIQSDRMRGFLGQLSVTCTGGGPANNPAIIYSVEAWGSLHRNLNIPD